MLKRTIISLVIISGSMLFNGCQKSAEDHYKKGMELVDSKSIFPAIEEFNQSIKANPKFAKAYLERGKCFLNQQPNKAVYDFTKVLELDSTLKKEALLGRGRAFFNLSGYEQAWQDLKVSLLIDPDNKQLLSLAVGCKILLKDKEGAKLLLDRRIKNDPKDAEAYYSRALYRITSFNDKTGGCEDLTLASQFYNVNEKYLATNLKKEIVRLTAVNCRKKK